jgi:hypothetical protein
MKSLDANRFWSKLAALKKLPRKSGNGMIQLARKASPAFNFIEQFKRLGF